MRPHRHRWQLVGVRESFWPSGATRMLAVERCVRCPKERSRKPKSASELAVLLREVPRA